MAVLVAGGTPLGSLPGRVSFLSVGVLDTSICGPVLGLHGVEAPGETLGRLGKKRLCVESLKAGIAGHG